MSLSCVKCGVRFKGGAIPAGARIRCPRCNTSQAVSATQVSARPRPATAVPPAGRTPPVPAETGAPQSSPVLWVSIGAGALMLLAIVGFLALALRGGGEPGQQQVALNQPPDGGLDSTVTPPAVIPNGDQGQSPPGHDARPGRLPQRPVDPVLVNPGRPKKDDLFPEAPANDGGGRLTFGVNEITFMGSKAKGRRFCIIADQSGSMSSAFRVKDPKGRRTVRSTRLIDYLKKELTTTLRSFKAENQFSVILFDSRVNPMPGGAWRNGGQEAEDLMPWVESIRPRGGTVPLPAFQRAFRLDPRPDVIFFMTDGQFSPSTAGAIARLNSGEKKVIINTIQLALPGRGTAPTSVHGRQMRRIADESGGEYRQVIPSIND